MNNLSIQSKTIQVDVPSNSYDNNSFTHISELSKKEINFPNTGKDFGLTKESNTVKDEIPQQEIWKTHDDYPGYLFSSFGRVYSYNVKPNRFLKGGKDKDEYIMIHLQNRNNKEKRVRLNRKIYELFGDDPVLFHHRQVDHIRSKEKQNNNINNLRLANQSENESNKGKQSVYSGKPPSSEYVGVCLDKQAQKWKANIKVGKHFDLGIYKYERNCAYVYNRVAKHFKASKHWKNTLPHNFQLPNESEDRDVKIQEGINKIQNWLNNQ